MKSELIWCAQKGTWFHLTFQKCIRLSLLDSFLNLSMSLNQSVGNIIVLKHWHYKDSHLCSALEQQKIHINTTRCPSNAERHPREKSKSAGWVYWSAVAAHASSFPPSPLMSATASVYSLSISPVQHSVCFLTLWNGFAANTQWPTLHSAYANIMESYALTDARYICGYVSHATAANMNMRSACVFLWGTHSLFELWLHKAG